MGKAYLTTEWFDEKTGATGYLVIDTLQDGFCAGGIRMKEGVSQEEVGRLAEIMTIKMAGLGMNVGGAKGGINFSPTHPESKAVLKRYLEAHLPYIKDCWLTSEDMGTREEDIAESLAEFGVASSVQAFIAKQENSEQLMGRLQKAMTSKYEGMKLTDLVTGYGVAVATLQGLHTLGRPIKGAKVAIQGFGSVGASAAKFLAENGVHVVAIADVLGTIFCEAGLDVPLLLARKDERGTIKRDGLPADYEQLPAENWLGMEVDVLIPAAVADAINEHNVATVMASLIVEGGNIPVTAGAEAVLFERNVLVIPDFIANSGGAGLFVSVLHGNVSGYPEEIFDFLRSQLAKTTDTIITMAKEAQILPREAARNLALNQGS